jgi:hypothetical protein
MNLLLVLISLLQFYIAITNAVNFEENNLMASYVMVGIVVNLKNYADIMHFVLVAPSVSNMKYEPTNTNERNMNQLVIYNGMCNYRNGPRMLEKYHEQPRFCYKNEFSSFSDDPLIKNWSVADTPISAFILLIMHHLLRAVPGKNITDDRKTENITCKKPLNETSVGIDDNGEGIENMIGRINFTKNRRTSGDSDIDNDDTSYSPNENLDYAASCDNKPWLESALLKSKKENNLVVNAGWLSNGTGATGTRHNNSSIMNNGETAHPYKEEIKDIGNMMREEKEIKSKKNGGADTCYNEEVAIRKRTKKKRKKKEKKARAIARKKMEMAAA